MPLQLRHDPLACPGRSRRNWRAFWRICAPARRRSPQREREAETRLAAAELAEERARATLVELQAAERALRATIALADGAAEGDLARLTAVYENMKPQQAAPLFQQMTPGFAAGFLGRMRPDAAAAILSGLEPEAAYAISVILAGRNARVLRSDP